MTVQEKTVLVSNGHGKFHMLYAAQAAQECGLLDRLITGAYPTAYMRRTVGPLASITKSKRLQRLLMRRVQGVDEDKIATCSWSETISQAANLASQWSITSSQGPFLHGLALMAYQREARKYVRRSSARVYHCRGGYGGVTLKEARKRRMAVLIDHSIAHPRALAQMIVMGGSYIAEQQVKLEPMWRLVEDDLREADLIIANSDFVRETLIDCGVAPERVAVLYLGIDSEMESYLENLPRERPPIEAGVRFLFAGSVERRKGVHLLLQAFSELDRRDWQLTIAGPVQADLRQRIAALRDTRVRVLGPVLRDELARLMLSHHVFVFPTLAEGSARVIFEAMAAGMAIITTPNAGSIVEDRRHGLLIQPGSHQSTLDAVTAILGPKRERIVTYGQAGDTLVKREYHSAVYKTKLVALYSSLAGS